MFELDSKCLIKDPTCFKSTENPSKIDLFITNCPFSFQNTSVLDTGLSDFHRMIVTVLKNVVPKSQPQEIQYRNLKNIDDELFGDCIRSKLLELTDKTMKTLNELF